MSLDNEVLFFFGYFSFIKCCDEKVLFWFNGSIVYKIWGGDNFFKENKFFISWKIFVERCNF